MNLIGLDSPLDLTILLSLSIIYLKQRCMKLKPELLLDLVSLSEVSEQEQSSNKQRTPQCSSCVDVGGKTLGVTRLLSVFVPRKGKKKHIIRDPFLFSRFLSASNVSSFIRRWLSHRLVALNEICKIRFQTANEIEADAGVL